MSNNESEEMCEVEVVLDEPYAEREDTVQQLCKHGLTVTNVDRDDGVVEGTIPASRLLELRRLESVAYVRIVFTYMADERSNPATHAPATTSDGMGRRARDRGAAGS